MMTFIKKEISLMFAKLKLGTKIALGFATMILLIIMIGAFVVWNMQKIKDDSGRISEKLMPQATLLNDVSRSLQKSLFEMRGFLYSKDKKYVANSQKYLNDSKEGTNKTIKFSEKFSELAPLTQAAHAFSGKLNVYEEMSNASVAIIEKIEQGVISFNQASKRFSDNTLAFQKAQVNLLKYDLGDKKRLSEIQRKISLINETIALGNEIVNLNLNSHLKNDPSAVQAAEKLIAPLQEKITLLGTESVAPDELKHLKSVEEAVLQYQSAMKEYQILLGESIKLTAKRLEHATEASADVDGAALNAINETNRISNENLNNLTRSIILISSFILVALFIGMALAFIITKAIMRPLNRAVDGMKNVTELVSSASEQLSSAAQQLSSGANEQASSIEETSSSLEEMDGMVQNNLSSINKTNDLINVVSLSCQQSGQCMESLQGSMQEILQSNAEIEKLVKFIAEIGEKTKIMDEIVFQTKLLSFNASVEAERAGEHGRGFAVVAQEVGNLAQMSGQAAREIAKIVNDSICNAETITNDNKRKVITGSNFASETVKSLKEIMQATDTVTQNAGHILTASQEQASGIKQINTAISALDKATQQNASIAEETASTSEELASQTIVLNDLVMDLARLIDGGAATDQRHMDARYHVSHKPALKLAHSSRGPEPAVARKFSLSERTRAKPADLKKVVGDDFTAEENPAHDVWDKI
jgi:methyl-accepting chemotaxis protein